MARRAGIQTEILISLALVMLLATLVLGSVLLAHHEASLRELLGRALLVEARAPRPTGESFVPGTEWWSVQPDGRAEPRGAASGPIDAPGLELARSARAGGVPLLQPGPLWGSIRFAAPLDARGSVVVGRLPADASQRLRLGVLQVAGPVVFANTLIFVALGGYLLRRRVARPLEQLAAAARALAEGEGPTRVAVEGSREAAELALAFNEMGASLAGRTAELEKAVVELRAANRELRRTRAGLDRAERLAVVGRLAAGVAHEVGNPIGAILALLELARRDPLLSEASRTHLERGAREGERVRRILRQLLDYSRPSRAAPVPVELEATAREAVALVAPQRRYAGVRFEVEGSPRAPAALADPGAVMQILLNLLLNAGDAVREAQGSRVALFVQPAWLETRCGDAGDLRSRRGTPDAVECVVADDGPGIPEADRPRLFDPFFTTKPPGEGTGLGLANAARLAEELEGSVELVEPPPGFATAFALRLPALEPAGAPTRTRAAEAGAGAAQPASPPQRVA